ncbi:GntR family transcriptional regulator [Acidisphaera sp. L21]|uniref:GntR family transcriptional regulator n=1 Tax=Acidisphaera sp. L21 TaxID=1641851 RepID=UPI0020B161FA|nr:GntR family transcriptional regulator [Acidisphaera sp. L21]
MAGPGWVMAADGEASAVIQSTRRQVEEAVRAAVVGGRFAPGQHLPDRVLCEEFGASRSVIREAVRLLEAEGLVNVLPNRGTFVAFLTAAEATQIYEVRGVLEALAGEGCAIRATDAERASLRDIYERIAKVDENAGQGVLLGLKQEFYDALLRGCHNPLVARMLDQVLNRNTQLRAMSMSEPGRLKHTVAELRRVVEAIEQRDPEGAWDACRIHVRRASTIALRILRQREEAAKS